MEHLFRKIALPPLLIAVLVLVAAALLACGPASQAVSQGQPVSHAAAQDSDTEPTPAPTPESTPTEPTPTEESEPRYPNLDSTLQEIVERFEAEELSEAGAAAQAPEHHGSTVLVEVGLSANVDAVDSWMGEQEISPRFKDPEYVPPHIYAYVKVSLLGALSQREGVGMVWAVEDPDAAFRESSSGASGQSGSLGTAEPELPIWLKDYPYPKLKGNLQELVYRYEQGEMTATEVASSFEDHHQGSSIRVQVELAPDPANTDVVATWLKSKGVSSLHIGKDEVYPNIISGLVPVSLLATLSQQPGVYRIKIAGVPGNRLAPGGFGPINPDPQSAPQGAPQSNPPPTPTPTPVTSQGVAAHGATAWDTAGYRGNGVKVGIIDSGFDGFNDLMGTELPPASKVEAQCYLSDLDLNPSTNIADCGDSVPHIDYHGTLVAQAVVDVAREVSLYISNASILNQSQGEMRR